ncbi:uncharacterized protein LOC113566014 [Drosophila persimilis]|uniref:uncharacterized protein LOC113566014 n=1 Tax=Drosophila persimilis TaxID=7234 RepID=UPI000F0748A6|nr:uncharacterized protein LOC113566014 [Drosophila persimilis]
MHEMRLWLPLVELSHRVCHVSMLLLLAVSFNSALLPERRRAHPTSRHSSTASSLTAAVLWYSEASWIALLQDRHVSMRTPRYLIDLCDWTAVVLWATSSSSATVSHASTARTDTAASSFVTVTIATSSEKPTKLKLAGIGILRTPSYMAFQSRGHKTESHQCSIPVCSVWVCACAYLRHTRRAPYRYVYNPSETGLSKDPIPVF